MTFAVRAWPAAVADVNFLSSPSPSPVRFTWLRRIFSIESGGLISSGVIDWPRNRWAIDARAANGTQSASLKLK